MPRPGPRPYECVKRAWHSDRHQPMRGSIIQQIFRLVTEAHCSPTRRNKEWQEKLPVVVLKAEEIMYSKANSEEEYINFETLLTRVNDAVDTIIRRDESTETGELLPPCVEAALNLGCIPVRASRSERHSNPRTYLSPRIQEPASAPSRTLDKAPNRSRFQFSSHNSVKLNSAARPATPAGESHYHKAENNSVIRHRGYPFLCQNPKMGYTQLGRAEMNPPANLGLGSVYPLYYGANNHTEQFHLSSRVSEHLNAPPIIVGMPIGVPILDNGEIRGFQNLFSHSCTGLVSRETGEASSRDVGAKPLKEVCDLSLRLGLSSDPCLNVGKSSTLEDIDSCSFEKNASNRFYPGRNKEIFFYPGKRKNNNVESHATRWFSNGEDRNPDESLRKRRTMFRESQ